MKKRWLSRLLVSSLFLALTLPVSAYADGEKVVTLGADLSEDQKTAVLRYFGVLGQSIRTLTITNQDERDHLASYVPLEQIGTRTFSCALVCPTTSGGIQVKTANLNWVTSNMIATTLSTSGVKNCDVLAASPFEVSGTGALTGVIMAYEAASGETLDADKKELATQELVTTATLADEIGQQQATNIVNEIKIQIIEGAVVEPEEVEYIVDDVIYNEPEMILSDEDRDLLIDLMTQISQQNYEYEDMRETLERVEENVSSMDDKIDQIQSDVEDIAAQQNEALASDSILVNTDDSALGENVIMDATNEDALPETEKAPENTSSSDPFEIVSSDSYNESDTIAIPDPAGNEADAWSDNTNTETPAENAPVIDIPQAQDNSGNEDVQTDNFTSDDTWNETPADAGDDGWTDTQSDSVDDGWTDTPAETVDDGWTDTQSDSVDDGWTDAPAETVNDDWTDAPAETANDGWNEAPAEEDVYTEPVEENMPEETPAEETPMEEAPAEIPALTISEINIAPEDSADAGINQIRIFLPNDNIVPVAGTLTVSDEWDNEVARVDFTDLEQVAAYTISEEDKNNYSWNGGTELLFNLGKVLDSSQSYTIAVEGTVAESTDPKVLDGAPIGEISEHWDLYVEGIGASVVISSINEVRHGSALAGTIYMDETAEFAEISDYDAEKISFDNTQFSVDENTSFTVSCLQSGRAAFTVDFYDAEDNWVGSAGYVLTIG